MLVLKSTEINIDLNAKDEEGMTAFHLACMWGNERIVGMMIDNAKSFKLDFITIDNNGRTGFQCAKHHERKNVVKIIRRKMPKIAL